MPSILILLIGILGGIAVGIQGPIVNAMGKQVGGAASIFIVHLSGAILGGLLLALRGGENIAQWRTLPWYMLLSGAFGVVLYLTLGTTIPELGATTALSLIIVGQLGCGLIIDHFGLLGVPVRPIDATRLLALGLLIAGGYLMSRR